MNRIQLLFITILFTVSCENTMLMTSAGGLKNLPVMDLILTQDDYLRLLENKSNDLDVPVRILYKNENVTAVIRASGAGSRYSPRWSYKVTLKNGSTVNNLTEFNISSQIMDPTMMYTTIATRLYRLAGFEVFNSEHLFLRINNRDQGLFLFIERVEEPFFVERNLEIYELYKSNGNSKFTFKEENNPQFDFEKKIPDDYNYNNLIELIHAVDTSASVALIQSLGKFLNIENYIRYHALTTLINNPDAFNNNFFVFKKDKNSAFEFLPWDFDRCFERTADLGLYGKNALIEKILTSEAAFSLYKETLKYQLDHIFTAENMDPVIDSLATYIREGYNIDPYLGKGRYDLDEQIVQLREFINNRIKHVSNDLAGFEFRED